MTRPTDRVLAHFEDRIKTIDARMAERGFAGRTERLEVGPHVARLLRHQPHRFPGWIAASLRDRAAEPRVLGSLPLCGRRVRISLREERSSAS